MDNFAYVWSIQAFMPSYDKLIMCSYALKICSFHPLELSNVLKEEIVEEILYFPIGHSIQNLTCKIIGFQCCLLKLM